MDSLAVIFLIGCAIIPFFYAAIRGRRPSIFDEPPFRFEGNDITAFPTCYHCGWQGALDVTAFVKSARMELPILLKSPPCAKCGQRWLIHLSTLVRKYRSGTFA